MGVDLVVWNQASASAMNNKLNSFALAATDAVVFVSLQLYFVYWDMSRCLRALTETLEECSSVANNTQVSESSTAVPLFVPLLLYRFFLWAPMLVLPQNQ